MSNFLVIALTALGGVALTDAALAIPILGRLVELEEDIEGIHE